MTSGAPNAFLRAAIVEGVSIPVRIHRRHDGSRAIRERSAGLQILVKLPLESVQIDSDVREVLTAYVLSVAVGRFLDATDADAYMARTKD